MSPLNPLNPATGDVPLPEDQREIDAALRAGRISHRVFPYVTWRYGIRGKKFTESDSAWLAWLTRHDPEHVYEQINWLLRVLSNRGMPSWILDTHLILMHRQLVRAIPENRQKYDSMATAANRIRQARENKIPAARGESLVAGFAATLGRKPSRWVSGAAGLIVAAVADEKLGVKHAVDSLQTWLADLSAMRQLSELRETLSKSDCGLLDSKSFQQLWEQAVKATIAEARKE